jgi:GAF domain-containing protein
VTDSDESKRQRELDRYRVVDTLPDEAYDDIVRVAAAVCEVPTALVSMIDRGRQWFKARTGFDRPETRRDEAFCDHAIRTPDMLFEVRDATTDPRFAENPLVVGESSVRFYAGMPLVTPAGAAIGTVCVLDKVPRSLTDAQRAALGSLARLTMNMIESRHRERELERAIKLAANDGAAHDEPSHCTVAIFEVQDVGEATRRLGERGFERVLQTLHDMLENTLRPKSGDSVSRVSGCAELVAVLHGEDTKEALTLLQDATSAFEEQTALRIVSASSRSQAADEALERVFLRADSALSAAKDAVSHSAIE